MFCNETEKFLREHGVEFTERNVAEDEAALAELERLGTLTTPVTVIREGREEKEAVVVGFDREKLKGLLRL